MYIAQCLKQPYLFTSFYTQVFPPGTLLPIFLIMLVVTVPRPVRVLVIYLLYQRFVHLLKRLSTSLAIALILMLLLFLMRFVNPPQLPLSDRSLNPAPTPRHTTTITYTWCFPCCLAPLCSFASLVMLCLRYPSLKQGLSAIKIQSELEPCAISHEVSCCFRYDTSLSTYMKQNKSQRFINTIYNVLLCFDQMKPNPY